MGSDLARRLSFRTALSVPLMREGVAIGSIALRRAEAHLFMERQIELLQTFADQAVIAIENVRLFKELETRNRDLTEALDQQTATSEILRVISQSPTDVQPVFDSIVASAVRLCGSVFGTLATFDGELLRLAATHNWTPRAYDVAGPTSPTHPSRGLLSGRAILERTVVHVPDVERDAEYQHEVSGAVGFRSGLAVPMLRDNVPLGVIGIGRTEPGPFSDSQIALLKTFADQAVIAVENVRLFTELQEKNQALTQAHALVTEALEQQTATSEILRAISNSPTDVQPTFEAIAKSAAKLCEAGDSAVFLFEAGLIHLMAHYDPSGTRADVIRQMFPMPPGRGSVTARAILTRAVVHIPDIADDPEYEQSAVVKAGFRSVLSVPILRDDQPIGALTVSRRGVKPFSGAQLALLHTFADQALIAIENVRLFNETKEALEQQTATSEILKVIASSPTDVQPVFDAIAGNAARLCSANDAQVLRVDGETLRLVAAFGVPSMPSLRQLTRGHLVGRAVIERRTIHIRDWSAAEALAEYPESTAARYGVLSALAVPLLRDSVALGVIRISRTEIRPFTDKQIALVKTFADQAVIAIENVRLFKELDARTQDLTRSVGELRALGEVGQAISSTLDLRTVLSTIVARAAQLSGTDAGVIYEYDEQREVFVPRATEHLEAEIVETMLATPVRKGEGATGRLAEVQEPIQVPDILAAPAESRVRGALVRAGYRALLAVPLVRDDHLLGGLTVIRKATGAFAPEIIDLLRTFATQSALAIQNARLFREIEDKSRQLEAASQHKSEFLANMSHELRTPLNAIIGFSEVLTDRMFGELNQKQEEYLQDIYASGTHLLSLINDILDLSKIEAGRMELELTDFHLPTALDNALTLVRERAGRRSIALHTSIDNRLGEIRADERKIRQVVLNLLSNAIKFTPEGGRIEVQAAPKDGFVEVSVSDTGVGISPEDQEAVFEEFRQVGTAEKKAEGTGLGLTLCRKFIKLHGGRIWVKSQVGGGSTFTFTIPVRHGE
jgi:GAF domain-containing protein